MKSILLKVIPFLFVVIWSSGFIVAKKIEGDIDPNIFLTMRFGFSALIFFVIAKFLKEKLPSFNVIWRLMVIGILVNGLYTSFCYLAILSGLAPALMSLIGSLQPPFTLILAAMIYQEKINKNIVIGMILGLIGVALALSPSLGQSDNNQSFIMMISFAFIAVIAITSGTLLQKTSVSKVSFMTASAIQLFGAALVNALMALMLGESLLIWTTSSIWTLTYAVLVLSLMGGSMLLYMVRHGSVTKTTSLFFLVPPVASVQAYLLFGNVLSTIQVIGFGIAIVGVYLSRKA